MDFITRCFKSEWLKPASRRLRVCALLFVAVGAQAQSSVEPSQLRIERADDEILVSAQVQFELPSAVEDALQKGLPLFFVADADILRERWYWYDKKVATAERHLRLSYQPLTRRWRLTVTSGTAKGSSPGLSLNQNFDTLPQALAIIKRVSRWKIADATELDGATKYKVEFRFRLDVSQLPLPFQIGTLGQTDWNVAVTLDALLSLDSAK
jgi:hypothetical protein